MIIVGGDFGEGSAHFGSDNRLVIEASNDATYLPEQISSITDSVIRKKLGLRAYIVGAIALSGLFALFVGFLGIVIGCVVAIPCFHISEETNEVVIQFNDNRSVKLECEADDVAALKKIAKSAPSDNKSDG